MVVLIFALALVFLGAAAVSFWAGLNLVPTDLGLVLYQVAAVFAAAGGLALALGAAVRAVVAAIHAKARNDEKARNGAAVEKAIVAEPPRFTGLERDLFSEQDPGPRPALAAPDISKLDIPPPETAAAPVPRAGSETAPEPAREMAVDAQASPHPEDESAIPAADGAREAAGGDAEQVAPPGEEGSSSSGLIADADLAAMAAGAAEEPPLAPIETLDVVGAYDSGGTRFTMYSDGSVHAVGPDGERRFRTLDDLRRFLDQKPVA